MLHVVSIAMTIMLEVKLNNSLQYSSEATFLYVFLLVIALGVAGALCQAAAFSSCT